MSYFPNVSDGTWTPTLTNTTNVAASTANVSQYTRLGGMVTMSWAMNIDPTTTGATVVGVSLPVASALANDFEAGGAGGIDTNNLTEGWEMRADATNDRITANATAVNLAAHDVWCTATYLIV